jgi:hypothetical protein
MMGSREKDQSDFDLETFVDLFDTAMTSDNPAVQRAFKNLMMIAATAHAKQEGQGLQSPQGPLRRLVDDVRNLNRRVNELEYQRHTIPSPMPSIPIPGTVPGPFWTSPNTTGSPPPWPPGSVTCSVTAPMTYSIDDSIPLTKGQA